MAAITSNASGNWSATGTWVGGIVPANGDTVTIAAGHTVTFNVDQTAFAVGIAGLTINGTLTASTTAGAYLLKFSGTSVTFGTNGQWNIGTSEAVPYPKDCSFTLQFTHATTHSIALSGNNNVHWYGLVPAVRSAYVTQAVAVANTTNTLYLDTDLTSYAASEHYWKAGDIVSVNKIWAGTATYAELTISAVYANRIVFTTNIPFTIDAPVTSNGVTTNGAIIVLAQRNVRILGSGRTSTNQKAITGSPATGVTVNTFIGTEFRNLYYVTITGFNALLFRKTLFIANAASFQSNYGVFDGIVGINHSIGTILAPNRSKWINSLFAGNLTAISQPANSVIFNCIIVGNNNGVYASSTGGKIINCQMLGNQYSLYYIFNIYAVNCIIAKSDGGIVYISGNLTQCTFANNTNDVIATEKTQVNVFNSTYPLNINPSSAGNDYGAGALWIHESASAGEKWTSSSGAIVRVSDIVPTGYSTALKFTQTDIKQPMYLDIPVRIENLTYRLDVWLRQSVALGTPLTVSIFPSYVDPHFSGSASASVSLTSGAIATWELKTIDVLLTAGDYIMRIEASHTVANASWWVAFRQTPVIDYVDVDRPVYVNQVLSATLAQTNLTGVLS